MRGTELIQASAVVLLILLMTAINLMIAVTGYFVSGADESLHPNINIGISFATIIVFYVIHFTLYYSWRWAQGKEAVQGFASSHLNFISAAIALLYFLKVRTLN